MNEDITWIEASANGDVDAFAKLVKKYSNAIYSVAYSVTGDFHLAQDIAQETFIKAFNHLSQLKSPDKFGIWLYSIARRLSIDWKRKQSREQTAHNNWIAIHGRKSFIDPINLKELQRVVWSALNELEEKNRVTMTLYYVSGLSMKEIGELLQLSATAVESRIRRSRKILRQYFMEQEAFEWLSSQQLGPDFVNKVSREIIKQAGHFYIPVADRRRSTQWYIENFGLTLDRNGHLLLPSGQTMFLLETVQKQVNVMSESPQLKHDMKNNLLHVKMSFMVDNLEYIHDSLKQKEVHITEIEEDPTIGKYFLFIDLDGNQFGLFEAIKK